MLFLKGLVLGFSIAAPVGPIGALCIQRTLARGRLVGLVTGLGAATVDAIYGCLAAAGLSAASSFLTANQIPIRLGGGLFLVYLGLGILRSRPAAAGAAEGKAGRGRLPEPGSMRGGLVAAYGSALVLTLTNPMTILSFAGIFAGVMPAGGRLGPWDPTTLVAGVFVGSSLWWLILSTLADALRSRLDASWTRRVNLVSALTVVTFGLAAVLTVFRS